MSFTVASILTVTNSKYGTIHRKLRQNPRLKIFLYRFLIRRQISIQSQPSSKPTEDEEMNLKSSRQKCTTNITHARCIPHTLVHFETGVSWRRSSSDLWPNGMFSPESESSWWWIIKSLRFSFWTGASWYKMTSFWTLDQKISTPLILFGVTSVHF